MFHRALALVLALTLASDLIASPALAGSDNRTIALDLFEQGRALFKDGNYQAALAKFEAAAEVMRSFGILLNVAECQEKLGRTASAWATWREARAVAAQAHSDDDEAMATARQKALEPALSRLTIVVPTDSDAPDLEIRRDGGVVPREAWGAAIAVDPGAHVIDAHAPGRTARKFDVAVQPNGGRASITVSALDTVSPPPTPPPATVVAPPSIPLEPIVERSDSASGQRVAGWILGGVGVAGVGAGIGIALAGQSKHDEAVAQDLAGNLPLAQQTESSANTTKIVGYAILGGGGAFLISGAVLLLTAHSPSKSNNSALTCSPWISSTSGGAVFSKVW
ncbi:MAG: hypothetical protein ABTD50_24030 [Polyangiaceae bacterium]|jgi:tetratricopeptide (TPR) repeat protein